MTVQGSVVPDRLRKVVTVRRFVNGVLMGLTYEGSLEVMQSSLSRYLAFIKSHQDKPVESIGGSDYVFESWKVLPEEGGDL